LTLLSQFPFRSSSLLVIVIPRSWLVYAAGGGGMAKSRVSGFTPIELTSQLRLNNP